jgi:aspartate ammonia-lyase
MADYRKESDQLGEADVPVDALYGAHTQAALTVCANDQAITQAAQMGSLELNPFLPLIADCLLTNLDLLARSCNILRRHCVVGLTANEERCSQRVESSTAVVTALVESLGYQTAASLAAEVESTGKTLRQIVVERELFTPEEFDALISPERVNQLGSSPKKDSQ